MKMFNTEGKDTRDKSRYHVKMIMGKSHVVIEDMKLVRTMKLDVSPKTISEENFAEKLQTFHLKS